MNSKIYTTLCKKAIVLTLSALPVSGMFSTVDAQKTGSFTTSFTFSSPTYAGQTRNIAFYVPSTYSKSKKYKLFISLGGQGWAITDDLISPYGPSSPGTVDELTNATYASKYGDFIAVSPEIGPDALAAGAPEGTWPYPPGEDDGLPEAIIKFVKATYNIDTNYVYLTGFSLGARGALCLGLESYKSLRGLILCTPAVQGQMEAEDKDAYQSQVPAYAYYAYSNAKKIPICMTVGSADPNGAGCSFCTPVDPVQAYNTVIVPQVKTELNNAGAGSMSQLTTITGLSHNRPSAADFCNCFNFIESKHTSTGINSPDGETTQFAFGPNPSTGMFYLMNNNMDKYAAVDVIVYNILGQTVYSNHVDRPGSNKVSIDLQSQPAGMYFVTVKAGDFVDTSKLVLQK